ncbi:APC family permease [Mycobacterium sp. SMC-4]|uniref:APC family permease n=1 Tax=Mycobacterium sp. SMC-4 TaxID=2857059 RepID=UPI003CFDF9A3
MTADTGSTLPRRLGTLDAVTLGLGSMVGAGIFVVLAPAAAAAGPALLIALVVAAAVAVCNGLSSARLAARYPRSGGAYVYGTERLGPFWGHTAGWSFIVGKTASCAAMALTVGHYVWPQHARLIAVAAVVILTALGCVGVQRSAALTRVIVVFVLGVLALVVVAALGFGDADAARLAPDGVSGYGVLQAAGLMFFAFAGYARIATLSEEVRDPEHTIPRAVAWSLAIALVVYGVVAVAVLAQLGSEQLADTAAPLVAAVSAAGFPALTPVVTVGAAAGALGALLALLLGVSRTTLAMARDRHLPSALAVLDPRRGAPVRAQLVVGGLVAAVAAVADVRAVIGFSSFGVLLYYAVANASAWTLGTRRTLPTAGLIGCVVLACTLPWTSVVAGAAVVAAGMVVYWTGGARTHGV